MNLEDLGNLGEFIAAIGVVGSFVYLAFQIRDNTRSLKATSYQNANTAFQSLLTMPTIHPELRELMVKAESNPELLSQTELRGLYGYYHSAFSCFQMVYKGYENGTGDAELWEGCLEGMKIMLLVPAVQNWWVDTQPPFSPSFMSVVESVRREIGST